MKRKYTRRPTQTATERECIDAWFRAALRYRDNWPREHYERRKNRGWIRGPLELAEAIDHFHKLLDRRIIDG